MVSHGLKTDCRIVSYLLQCFTKVGMTFHVTEHFQKFRDSGVHLDGALYNFAMNAYCKLGNMDEAVKLLAEMKTHGLAPDQNPLYMPDQRLLFEGRYTKCTAGV
jgi:pentatricopeptide repeat protein